MRLRYLAAAPLVAVAMFGTTAAAWPSGTAAVPEAPPALTASALSARYTANARPIRTAERAAIRHRDSQLASALASLGRRQVLFFNPDGQGVAAMVLGNLATATRVAILVPGSDTTLATFFSRGPASPGGGAFALAAEAHRLDPGERLAIIAWLGYPAPALLSPGVMTSALGHRAGPAWRPGRAAVPQLRLGGLRASRAAPAGHRHRGVRQPWDGRLLGGLAQHQGPGVGRPGER